MRHGQAPCRQTGNRMVAIPTQRLVHRAGLPARCAKKARRPHGGCQEAGCISASTVSPAAAAARVRLAACRAVFLFVLPASSRASSVRQTRPHQSRPVPGHSLVRLKRLRTGALAASQAELLLVLYGRSNLLLCCTLLRLPGFQHILLPVVEGHPGQRRTVKPRWVGVLTESSVGTLSSSCSPFTQLRESRLP